MAETNKPFAQEHFGKDGNGNDHGEEHILTISGMYQNYFLDYASYVILERAVPAVEDGLKPVQRRILHAMYEMNDGRFHKVANIIGQTMQYHPHGDAAIGDALVNLGQKDLLIDTQGNWGDYRTGDSAAAPRYIEARLSKFALEVAFNPQITQWQLSYDGRKKEPITLPMKFPLVLAQGAEGIAVGLSTKILPHNFNELCKASIDLLRGKPVKIYPDFPTGGMVDVSEYNGGKRGGRIKSRARIEKVDKNKLVIKDLPFGVTTEALIDSITKAAEKGKIKIKKIDDNTAAEVEIVIELASGVSPDLTIDALYAFTACETSITPNACVIIENKPHFLTVEEILRISTENTKDLLRQELEIKLNELKEKWFFASLEKIFIENRVYHKIEDCESWEEVMTTIHSEMRKYITTPADRAPKSDKRLRLFRELSDEDVIRLTEIRIKRISKYNSFKADERIQELLNELAATEHHLANLTDYAVAWFEMLQTRYGADKHRKTIITNFENIQATEVVANNAKLYVNRKEGFVGMGLKKDEYVCDCSDIDDIIVFRKDGKFQVVRIADKVFVGKDIIHVAVWKKGDDRTTYNMIYVDGKTGISYAKRFNVTAITREKEYDLTSGAPNSKVLYFSANPNGEAELVTILLSPGCSARIKNFDYGFADLAIKGRNSKGNIVTKYPVKKIALKEVGQSTIGAMKVWMDEVSGKLNTDERGRFLGEFDTGEYLLAIYKDGTYEVATLDLTRRFDVNELEFISQFDVDVPINAIYFDGYKERVMVKRFFIETTTTDQKFSFITDHKNSKLIFASASKHQLVKYTYKTKTETKEAVLNLSEFMDIKGWKAIGNKLTDYKLIAVEEIPENPKGDNKALPGKNKNLYIARDTKIHAGDTIEFDLDDKGQGKLF